MRRLIIHAPNIHQGGGKILLEALLKSGVSHGAIVVSDQRMPLDGVQEGKLLRRVQPTVVARLLAEVWLSRTASADDVILCFGNLPPLFRSPAHVVVFLQNKYLVSDCSLAGLRLSTRIRLQVERLWFKRFAHNVNKFIVQTPSMKDALDAILKTLPVKPGDPSLTCSVYPFVGGHAITRLPAETDDRKTSESDFVYIASGEAHKNHRCLIEAWCLLAADGYFPSLTLTIDKASFPALCEWMDRKILELNLRVHNRGILDAGDVAHAYLGAKALIFPSVFESFGLPLIEAKQAGLPIVASELDFVRDVVDPDMTFDPSSPRSIARAVKRFLGLGGEPFTLADASSFLGHVLE